MKVNDLVMWNGQAALITELYQSKMWRTSTRGRSVCFKDVEPEPFARIFVRGYLHGVPLVDLKPIDETR